MLVITAQRHEAITLVITDAAGNAIAEGELRLQEVVSGEKVKLSFDLPGNVSVTRGSAKNKTAAANRRR